MYVCIFVWYCVCMYVCVHMYHVLNISMNASVHICMYVLVYASVYMHVHILVVPALNNNRLCTYNQHIGSYSQINSFINLFVHRRLSLYMYVCILWIFICISVHTGCLKLLIDVTILKLYIATSHFIGTDLIRDKFGK